MRMLWPQPGEVDPDELYANAQRHRDGRPWLLANMVTSLDGGISVGGVSGTLGGTADHQVFHAIRAVADIILVGAGTMRAEHYGPPVMDKATQAIRTARGQTAVPRLAIVSGRLDLDPTARVFTEAAEPPIVLTGSTADPELLARLEGRAEVVSAGATTVEPDVALDELARRGAKVVVCEGGPTWNGRLLAADLVDELCMTLAPTLLGGDGARMIVNNDPPQMHDLTLAHVLEQDGVLLMRYTR